MSTRGAQGSPRRLLTDWTTEAGVAGDGLAALVVGPDAVPEAVHLATLGYEVLVLDGAVPDTETPSRVHVVGLPVADVPAAWSRRFALVLVTAVHEVAAVVDCVAEAGLLVVLGDAAQAADVDASPLVEVRVDRGPDPDAPAVDRFRAVHARL